MYEVALRAFADELVKIAGNPFTERDAWGISPIDRMTAGHGALAGGVLGAGLGGLAAAHMARGSGGLWQVPAGMLGGMAVGGLAGYGGTAAAHKLFGNPEGESQRHVLYGGGLPHYARTIGKKPIDMKPKDYRDATMAFHTGKLKKHDFMRELKIRHRNYDKLTEEQQAMKTLELLGEK